MVRKSTLCSVAALLLLFGLGRPAHAQLVGALSGRVVDDKGKNVVGASVTVTNVDVPPRAQSFQLETDRDGQWAEPGLPMGQYRVEARKGNLSGALRSLAQVRSGDMTNTGDLAIKAPAPAAATGARKDASDAETKAMAAKNERAAKQQAALAAADTAVAAGNFDDAIAKLTDVSGLIDNCGACFTKIGNIYLDQKKDAAGAEKADLEAIELNDKMVSDPKTKATDDRNKAIPYQRLAGIYNDQSKFDEASKMAAKANDMLEAGGGSGDPISVFNQGISQWNAGKMAEAQASFEKVIKLDPKYAEAYYQLGMTLVNQNKLPEAKAPFTQYLKLAPTGPNAGTAKALLDSIK